MKNISSAIFGMAFLLTVQNALALPAYINRVPNGGVFRCATCHTAAPDLNAFGGDFLAAGLAWGATLAAKDSDGDGATNGQELGDPNGTGTPTPGAQVTNPGDPNSKPPPTPEALTITTQPASQSVLEGANVNFVVVASGGTGTLTYQWEQNGTAISNATSATLTLNSVTTADNGTYTVVVTDTGSHVSLTSAPATLTVTPAPAALSVSLSSPANGATFNAPATFDLVANVAPVASVTRVDFFEGSSLIGSVSSPPFSMTVNNLGAGNYTFTATAVDNAGFTTNSAPVSVTVIGPPPPSGPSVVTVTAIDPNASEAGPDPGSFRISRTGEATNDLTVFYLLGGTAVNGQDYELLPTSITLGTGETNADLIVTPIQDTDTPTENSDTVVLQLTAPPAGQPGYEIGTLSNATITITEAPPPPPTTNQPPAVRIVTPVNGATFRPRGNILLVAEAADSEGTVTRVEFFAGTKSLGRGIPVRKQETENDADDDDTGSERSMLFYQFFRRVAPGEYDITATATDNLGATSTSAPVHIVVTARPQGRPNPRFQF